MIIQGDPKDAYQKAENYSEVFKDVLLEKNFIQRKKVQYLYKSLRIQDFVLEQEIFIRKKIRKLYVFQNMYD